MRIYHQIGHNAVWNLNSFVDEFVGDGLILSPVNMSQSQVSELTPAIRHVSIFDPQIYLPRDVYRELSTYDYFPANLVNIIETSDYSDIGRRSAEECVNFQADNNFAYLTIPARHFEQNPTNYYEHMEEDFVNPFISYCHREHVETPLLLTVIVKQIHLSDEVQRDDLLNWVTRFNDVSGVYLIFEHNFPTKQIKDSEYLFQALKFIHLLRETGLEVHIGYVNTEAFLYSVAFPTSVSIGHYENLRNFRIARFSAAERGHINSPNPRLYIGALLQWVDFGYLGGIKNLYEKWSEIHEPSHHNLVMSAPGYSPHSNKPDAYKHYFNIFNEQITALPSTQPERMAHVQNHILAAIERFNEIQESGVVLDTNSDGSHLTFWVTALSMYRRFLQS